MQLLINFDFRSSLVGYVLNNNFENSRNDQKWLQVRLIVQKDFFWNCQNFDVTVLPLNIDNFLQN